jgi:hypothetical protein
MTPAVIARLMAEILAPEADALILDPGGGGGALSRAVLDENGSIPKQSLTIVETDPAMVERLRSDSHLHGAEIIEAEFIRWSLDMILGRRRWTHIIANPPYLNFHDYDRRVIELVNSRTGLKMSKLANLYAVFVLLSARLLAPGGKMVFITPTEIFTTNYGKRTLNSLAPSVSLRAVVVFEAEAEPFEDANTSSCITLFERSKMPAAAVEIRSLASSVRSDEPHPFSSVRLVESGQLLLNPKLALSQDNPLADLPPSAVTALGTLVRASRGIATGSNSFFAVPDDVRQRIDPRGEVTVPVIARAQDIGKSIHLTPSFFESLRSRGARRWLFYVPDGSRELPAEAAAYVRAAEGRGVSHRYLCQNRRPWYSSEPQDPPLALVRVFGRDGLRIALNEVGVRTLTCCHRLHHHKPARINSAGLLLLACYLVSSKGQRAAATQYRHYGSGLTKLEPRDLEGVPVPDLRKLDTAEVEELASSAQKEILASGEMSQTFDRITEVMFERLRLGLSLPRPVGRGDLRSWVQS